jgi:hypothetical protein
MSLLLNSTQTNPKVPDAGLETANVVGKNRSQRRGLGSRTPRCIVSDFSISLWTRTNPPFLSGFAKSSLKPPVRRYGRGAIEVIVVSGIVAFAMILVLMALPRGREVSRLAVCQNNLRQIGNGLAMYHQTHRLYPTVPSLDGSGGPGPIKSMLDAFVIPDLLEVSDPTKPPKPSQSPPKGARVPGLACPSDSNAMAGVSPSSISYRANTGDDPGGSGGPFHPGRALSSAQVEEADGLSFTAAFAERLVGDGHDRQPALWNYVGSAGPVGEGGCPDAPLDRWKGDAGFDWAEASWRSTLYAHIMPPNGTPSCISADGRTALIGASSGHVNRLNVLLLDGSLRGVTPSIDSKVWRALGTVGLPDSSPAP